MSSVYCIDTSSLIGAWRDYYPIRAFPTLWGRIDNLISCKRMRAPMPVYDEIQKRSEDSLAHWCKARKQSLFVELDEEIMLATGQIVNQFKKLTQPVKGRGIADGFVVAAAVRHGWVVVTQENSAKNSDHIPDVCTAVGIECIRIFDVIAREEWIFK